MKGTRHLLARLDALKNAVDNGVPGAIDQIVRTQGQAVDQGFATAQYEGNNDVVIATDGTAGVGQGEWVIDASGTTVLFIEYGSGINLRHDSEFGNFGAYPPASWSASHARFLVPPLVNAWDGWWPVPKGTFAGKAWTQGNPSNNVMYQAHKTLRDTLPINGLKPIRDAMS